MPKHGLFFSVYSCMPYLYIWVYIFCLRVGEKCEWGMIELQGALETKDGVGFNGLYVGDLHFDNKVFFYVLRFI